MKYIINTQAIVLYINNRILKIEKTDARYASVIKVLNLPQEQQESEILNIITDRKKKDDAKSKGFIITEDSVLYNKQKIPDVLAKKVRSIYNEGLPLDLFAAFWSNLSLNPSQTSVNELYDFLAYKELPITEDGCFLAYKGVRSNYYSVNGNSETQVIRGKVDNGFHIYNGVGEYIEVLRRNVDDDRSQHCSTGLHAGSLDYARNFAERLIVVKINPKDVVSVPSDYNFQKLRCCAYTVVADFVEEIIAPVVDEENNAVESFDHITRKEVTKDRATFIQRIDEYLLNKSAVVDNVSIRQIQAIFSPYWPSPQEVKDALQDLEYTWDENNLIVFRDQG